MMEAIAVAREEASRIKEQDWSERPPADELVSAIRELAYACERLEERVESLERGVRNIGSHPALV